MIDNTDRWEIYWGDLLCPICDARFDVAENEHKRYRHCPYCGERLYPPKEEDE